MLSCTRRLQMLWEKHFAIRDCGVDIERFNKGYTMFLFDLSDSILVSNNVKTSSGELRLRMDFTEALSEPVDLIALICFK